MLRHVEGVSLRAATCRYYGISRQAYYGCLRRFEADGLDGLKDRSSRPHHSPRLTQAEVIEKIVWLRKYYHFGPAKIAMDLARYHDVTGNSHMRVAIRRKATRRDQQHRRRYDRIMTVVYRSSPQTLVKAPL